MALPQTQPSAARRGTSRISARSPAPTMVRLFGAVVCLVAPFALLGPAASADRVSSVQAQIASVRGQIATTAGRVHQMTAEFDQANVTAVDLAQQLAADEVGLLADRARLEKSKGLLRDSALESYTGGGGGPVASTPGTALDPALSSAYIEVAVGSLNDSVDQYDLRQRQLEHDGALVVLQQHVSDEALTASRAARDRAIAAAVQAEARLGDLQAQLDRLAAAAAAADATGRASAVPVQGGPVDNGLVAAVRGIVKPPSQPATPQPTATPPAATPPTTPTTVPVSSTGTTTPPPSVPASVSGALLQLRVCESSDNYTANTGNGFYGAYQFSASTWTDLGYPGRPDQAPPAVQDAAAIELQARGGWAEWPGCAAALGL